MNGRLLATVINLGNGSVLQRLNDLGIAKLEQVVFADHHRKNSQGFERLNRQVTKVAILAAERGLFETPTAFRKREPELGEDVSAYGIRYVRPARLLVVVVLGFRVFVQTRLERIDQANGARNRSTISSWFFRKESPCRLCSRALSR